MKEALFSSLATQLFFQNKSEKITLQRELDLLISKKKSWDEFNKKIENPLTLSRLNSINYRTLLHFAILENQLDIIKILTVDPLLKLRPDIFGLSPLDIAQFLNRKEALEILNPLNQVKNFVDCPLKNPFEYLPYPTFLTREGFEQVLGTVTRAKREDKIPAEKIWMGIYYDKEICKGLHPLISIQTIDPEIGFGVFANQKIAACSYVGEYTGVIKQRSRSWLKDKRYCVHYPVWDRKKNFCIDAEEKGNFTRFINHSSSCNLGLQSIYWRGIPRMIFIALRAIQAGEQLTFDYGAQFWMDHPQTSKAL